MLYRVVLNLTSSSVHTGGQRAKPRQGRTSPPARKGKEGWRQGGHGRRSIGLNSLHNTCVAVRTVDALSCVECPLCGGCTRQILYYSIGLAALLTSQQRMHRGGTLAPAPHLVFHCHKPKIFENIVSPVPVQSITGRVTEAVEHGGCKGLLMIGLHTLPLDFFSSSPTLSPHGLLRDFNVQSAFAPGWRVWMRGRSGTVNSCGRGPIFICHYSHVHACIRRAQITIRNVLSWTERARTRGPAECGHLELIRGESRGLETGWRQLGTGNRHVESPPETIMKHIIRSKQP